MEITVMTFGKYQHKPINEVPYKYLHWCAKQDWCPVYIAVELDRRGAKYIEPVIICTSTEVRYED